MIQNSSYLISRNGIYYYSRRVPADLHKRFNKDRVIISLRTRSQDKALRSAQTLSDRLERHWEAYDLSFFIEGNLAFMSAKTYQQLYLSKILVITGQEWKSLGSGPIFSVSMNTQMWTYQPEYQFSL